jgi:hypothetical protein
MKYIHNYNIFESISNNQFLKTKKGIEAWLNKVGIYDDYFINNNLIVDVYDDVNISSKNLKIIPLQFGKIEGYFDCSENKLTSLKGSPVELKENFCCQRNKLTSLEGSPYVVHGDFYGNDNKLKSLKGCPKEINGEFNLIRNNITDVHGFPKLKGNFYFQHNPIATFLDYRDDPEDVFTWIEYLNDYNVISGEKIFIEKLKEVLYLLNIDDFNFKELKKYYTIID